jgi:hypothetical protein
MTEDVRRKLGLPMLYITRFKQTVTTECVDFHAGHDPFVFMVEADETNWRGEHFLCGCLTIWGPDTW